MHNYIETEYGRFFIDEVYVYYDGPKLFLCSDASGSHYLAVAVDDDDLSEKWFYSPISNNRLSLLKEKRIELRTAFSHPETGYLFSVCTFFDNKPATIKMISPDLISPEYLPDEEVYLENQSDAEHLIQEYQQSPLIHAIQQLCNTIDIHIQTPSKLPSGIIGLQTLGQTISRFQSLIYSIMHPSKGRIPASVKTMGALYANACNPGSFQVRTQQFLSLSLFETEIMSNTINECFELLSAADNRDLLLQNASRYNLIVLAKYHKFLESLASDNCGIALDWASPNGDFKKVNISSEQIASIISYFNEEETLTSRPITVEGYITAIDVNKKRFTLTDLNKLVYNGTVAKSLRISSFSVPWDDKQSKLVSAEMEETIDFNVATDEEKYTYHLLSVSYI